MKNKIIYFMSSPSISALGKILSLMAGNGIFSLAVSCFFLLFVFYQTQIKIRKKLVISEIKNILISLVMSLVFEGIFLIMIMSIYFFASIFYRLIKIYLKSAYPKRKRKAKFIMIYHLLYFFVWLIALFL